MTLERREGGEGGRERQRDTHTELLFLLFMYSMVDSCFLYVLWPGTEPPTLAYQNDTLANWAIQPGARNLSIFSLL